MIRIIVRSVDGGAASSIPDTPVEISHKTFDIEAEELEKFLREPRAKEWSFVSREVTGVEVL